MRVEYGMKKERKGEDCCEWGVWEIMKERGVKRVWREMWKRKGGGVEELLGVMERKYVEGLNGLREYVDSVGEWEEGERE